jgi:hypothetical protein
VSDSEGKSFNLLNLGSLTKPIDTATKGLMEGAGAFLGRICLPAAEEVGLLLRDKVSYWRALNLAKVLKKTEDKLKSEFKEIPLKIILPIAENASLEEDDELQGVWANLLASALDPSFNGKIRVAYIDTIKQLEVIDVHILNVIYQSYIQWREEATEEYKTEPGFYFSPIHHGVERREVVNKLHISHPIYENAIDNLMRVRCVSSFVESKEIETEGWDEDLEGMTFDHRYESVCMTTLGLDFVEACITLKL